MRTDTRYSNAGLLALTNADLERQCPAAFATQARNDVSSRYGFVSTASVVEAMRANGFVPTHTMSYHRRDPSNRAFTKHLIRFRPGGDNVKKLTRGDVVPQLVLVNSHDRSSQFELFGGLWRLVCENGMLMSEGAHVEPLIVRHTTSSIDGILDASGQLIKQQKYVFEHVDEMKKIRLDEKQQREFATAGLTLRPERAGVIDPLQLLRVRRPEDDGDTLWQVFNRVQEAMIRGGQTGVTANNRAIVTRGTNAVNADIEINAGLWRIAVQAIAKAQASSAATLARPATARKTASKAAA